METISNESATYFKIFKFLFTKPTKAFNLILEKDETFPQTILLGIYGLLNVIVPILVNEPLTGLTIFKLVFKGLLGAAVGWMGIWFLSHLINLANNVLKANSEFEDVFFIFSYSLCPFIVSLLLILIISFFLNAPQILYPIVLILVIIGYIWTFVLVYKGNRLVAKGNWIKSIVAIIIPVAIIVGLNILMLGFNV